MVSKIIAGLFIVAMLAAFAYGATQLISPSQEVHAREGGARAGQQNGTALEGNGQGGQGRGRNLEGSSGSGNGQGREQQGAAAVAGRGQGQGNGQRLDKSVGEAADVLTIEGTVLETAELVVETADGEVQVGLGPSHYREAQGFALEVGDQVRVSGYWEDGEFKASAVENLETGERIVLRDGSGRPMWSGQARRNG